MEEQPYLSEFSLGFILGGILFGLIVFILMLIFCYRYHIHLEIKAFRRRMKDHQDTNDIISGVWKDKIQNKN